MTAMLENLKSMLLKYSKIIQKCSPINILKSR